MDRSRYDSAMFWLPFGTAAAVIGLALMTIGITRLAPNADVLGSGWFDGGLGILVIGALLLLWSLWLFLGRRRDAGKRAGEAPTPAGEPKQATDLNWKDEAVRGYYRERENMFRIWQKQQKDRKNRR